MLMYLHGEYVMSFELSILNLKTYLINLNLKNYFFAQTIVSHGRMGRGGMGGHVPPPQILRSGKNHCEIRAKPERFLKNCVVKKCLYL